jgi:ankyrin repeat protein
MDADEHDVSLPPLYHACVADDLPLVKRLLAEGADPNDGESVFHAAQFNRSECLALMLAHGADLSSRSALHGNTPLYFLAGVHESDRGAAEATAGMRWLLEHDADPNVTSYEIEETPLHALARSGWNEPMAELLVAHGASLDAPRADGRTAFVLAVRSGCIRGAAFLRSRGAAVSDLTPADEFLGACLRGDESEARARLASHPDVLDALSREDAWGGTPLHHAAWHGRLGMVRSLLTLGAPVNVRDLRFGSSPLGWAAHGSTYCERAGGEHVAVVTALLDAGADRLTSINRWNEPPESMASPEVAQILRARGFTP